MAHRGDGKSVTIRGAAAEMIGAVAWHGVSDADTAGAAIDAQLTAIAKAVVRATGADESLICHYYADDFVESEAAKALEVAEALRSFGADAAADAFEEKEKRLIDADHSDPKTHFRARRGEARDKIEASRYLDLWDSAVSPMLVEWREWYKDKHRWSSYFTELTEAWASYTGWAKRVNELRDLVEKAGIRVGVPRMMEFPESYKDKGEKAAGELYDLVKVAIYGALGIAGIAALVMVARSSGGSGAGAHP